MRRPKHPKRQIERAVAHAERNGWRVRMSSGHAWGVIMCPEASRRGHSLSINSTPKSADNEARRIIAFVDRCLHGGSTDANA